MRLVRGRQADGAAAQQIEGGVGVDGRGESIWDRFATAQAYKVQDGSNGNQVSQNLLSSAETRLATRIMSMRKMSSCSSSTKPKPTASPSPGQESSPSVAGMIPSTRRASSVSGGVQIRADR